MLEVLCRLHYYDCNSSISSSYFFFSIFLLSYFPVRLFQSHCRSPKITQSKDSQKNQNLAIRY